MVGYAQDIAEVSQQGLQILGRPNALCAESVTLFAFRSMLCSGDNAVCDARHANGHGDDEPKVFDMFLTS